MAGALLIFLLIVPANKYIVNYLLQAWEIAPQAISNMPEQATAIILTGVTQLNKKPYDRVYFQKGADRVTQALMLYRKGKVKQFVITGGSGKLIGEGRDEASELKSFLLDCNIPDSLIRIETQAKNTHENAAYTRAFLEEHKQLKPPYILITSAFHMRRSLGCFQKEKIHCIAFPVDYYTCDTIDNPVEYVIPEVGALANFSILIHELFGYAVYKVMGYL